MLNVICETESSVEAAETGETSRDFILRGRDKNPRNIFTVQGAFNFRSQNLLEFYLRARSMHQSTKK